MRALPVLAGLAACAALAPSAAGAADPVPAASAAATGTRTVVLGGRDRPSLVVRVPAGDPVRRGVSLTPAGRPAKALGTPLPAALDLPVTLGTRTMTVHLTRVPLHGPHFALYAQADDGTLVPQPTPGERSYLGTVAGRPDAYAAATYLSTGRWRGEIVYDRGATWFFDVAPNGVGTVKTRGVSSTDPTAPQATTYAWPTKPNLTDGTRATQTYTFEEAVDVTGEALARITTITPLDAAESTMNEIRATYLHDALELPTLGPVVLRTSATASPYAADPSTRLGTVHAQWGTGGPLASLGAGGAMGVFTQVGGGVAYKVQYSPSYAQAACDVDANGDFAIVCRHELGHTMNNDDNHSGNSEGATIMQGNAFARFGGSEVQTIWDTRDARSTSTTPTISPVGTWTRTAVPPNATLDLVDMPVGAATVSVLANDYDANGQAVTLTRADSSSVQGGVVTRNNAGTVTYVAPLGGSGLDSFTYTVTDTTGMTATGVVLVRLS